MSTNASALSISAAMSARNEPKKLTTPPETPGGGLRDTFRQRGSDGGTQTGYRAPRAGTVRGRSLGKSTIGELTGYSVKIRPSFGLDS